MQEDLSKLIKRLLKKRHLTQKELAKASGIPVSTIGSYINGGRINPSADKIFNMAAALKEPVETFFIACGYADAVRRYHI